MKRYMQLRRQLRSTSRTILFISIVLLFATLHHQREFFSNLQDSSTGDWDSSSTKSSRFLDLGLPNGTKILLNFGSNLDPIIPRPEDDDECTVTIAFEPIVHNAIPSHPAVYVVPIAVADYDGLAMMNVYNTDGVSSSLSTPVMTAKWNRGKRATGPKVVPVLSVKTIMQTLVDKRVAFIKTDMQGFDFAAISSVSPETWKHKYQIPHLITEVYLESVKTYAGVSNDLCLDWLPFMKKAGYIFEGLTGNVQGYESQGSLEETCRQQASRGDVAGKKQRENGISLLEANALWRHYSQPPTPIGDISTMYEYPVLGQEKNENGTRNRKCLS